MAEKETSKSKKKTSGSKKKTKPNYKYQITVSEGTPHKPAAEKYGKPTTEYGRELGNKYGNRRKWVKDDKPPAKKKSTNKKKLAKSTKKKKK